MIDLGGNNGVDGSGESMVNGRDQIVGRVYSK